MDPLWVERDGWSYLVEKRPLPALLASGTGRKACTRAAMGLAHLKGDDFYFAVVERYIDWKQSGLDQEYYEHMSWEIYLVPSDQPRQTNSAGFSGADRPLIRFGHTTTDETDLVCCVVIEGSGLPASRITEPKGTWIALGDDGIYVARRQGLAINICPVSGLVPCDCNEAGCVLMRRGELVACVPSRTCRECMHPGDATAHVIPESNHAGIFGGTDEKGVPLVQAREWKSCYALGGNGQRDKIRVMGRETPFPVNRTCCPFGPNLVYSYHNVRTDPGHVSCFGTVVCGFVPVHPLIGSITIRDADTITVLLALRTRFPLSRRVLSDLCVRICLPGHTRLLE